MNQNKIMKFINKVDYPYNDVMLAIVEEMRNGSSYHQSCLDCVSFYGYEMVKETKSILKKANDE